MQTKNILDLRQAKRTANVPPQKDIRIKKGPGKSLLITGAVCFSVILGAFAYKIALAHKNSTGNLAIVSNISGIAPSTDELINNALQEAEINALTLANSTSTNPFAIKPTDSTSDRVAKSLFAGYMNADQGGEITADRATDVAGMVISQITDKDLPQPQYSMSNIITFIPPNTDQIKQYGNIVAGTVIQNYKIIANNKGGPSQNLRAIEEVYINIGKSLIKLSVPRDIASEHLELANSFLMLADAMKMVEKQSTDPVQALLGVKTLQAVSTAQQNVLIKMANYFQINDIIFTSSDVGVLWNGYKNIPFGIPAEISTGATGAAQ